MDLISLFDYEAAVEGRLPKATADYYASGACDEVTLSENRAAYNRITLKYRVLRDISQRDLSTHILEVPISMPIIVAPTAFHKLAHPDGEAATARATAAAGTIMILSTLSNTSIEEVTAASTGAVWFQLYVYKDRGVTEALVQRAEDAGCSAIVLTVDAQLWGKREADVRNRFHLPEGLTVENLLPAGKEALPDDLDTNSLAAYVFSLFDPTLSWKDLEWLRSVTALPLLVKGIVHADDARLACDHGVDGIVVSNHGGRQLDTAPATIDVLPEIAEAVAGRADLIVDGGVRRGTDVVKALALGAKAVGVGRPVLWGLTVGGEKGVAHVLSILREEIDLAMGLCGCDSVAGLGLDLIATP